MRMVDEQLRGRGLRDDRVLDAIVKIPRECFVPENQAAFAYDDRALPIDSGQTISQPFIVAYMTEKLAVTPQSKVLEIGTGSGYQTAILASLAGQVYTVERIESLEQTAAKRLAELGLTNISFLSGDGSLGWPAHAPYDRIIVTAGAPQVPQPLIDQLADGGVIIIPVGHEGGQRLVRLIKRGSEAAETQLIACRFVKLIGERAWNK